MLIIPFVKTNNWKPNEIYPHFENQHKLLAWLEFMDWYQLMFFFPSGFIIPFVILSNLQCFIHIAMFVLI
jgi:hypothetical protein